jgi:hypothetical protein
MKEELMKARLFGMLRRVRVPVLAVMVALVLVATPVALAANGKPLILGKGNLATKITNLTGKVANGAALLVSNPSGGPALDLRVRAGKAPMKVNSAIKVDNLNADKVDGKHANELTRVGQISSFDSFTLLETDAGYGGVLLIDAPAAGFVRVNGNVSAAPTATAPCSVSATNGCYFGAKIRHVESGTDSQTSQDSVVGSFARGNVGMDAVFPVNAGLNRFIIVVHRSPGGSGTLRVTAAQLTAEYTPYGSTG